jgi:hypothetical protein
MTAETDHMAYRAATAEANSARAKPATKSAPQRPPAGKPLRRLFGGFIFSSLTHRILFLNLAALGVLMSGILYINQFREGLIDARVESLMTQGEIIAGAIAASANVETNAILIDPDKLLELQAGESIVPNADRFDSLDFPINPERVAPVLRRLISPTRTRARIYDRDANLLLDSRHLYSGGQVLRYDLPPVGEGETGIVDRIDKIISYIFRRRDLSRFTPSSPAVQRHRLYRSDAVALAGGRSQIVRITTAGRDDRFGRRADPALSRRTWRAAIVDPGRRYRQDRARRTLRHDPRLRRRRDRQHHPVGRSCRNHRQPAAPVGRRRRARAPVSYVARGNPRLLKAPGRDRKSVGSPARDDQFSLCPHRRHRELCRRCQP